jgi:molybdopterin converting factor small subunit
MSGNTISVRLHGHLVRYAGEKTSAFPVPIGAAETLAELVQRFGIPRAEISMIAINGRTETQMDTPLHPGDQVSIFGLVGGG